MKTLKLWLLLTLLVILAVGCAATPPAATAPVVPTQGSNTGYPQPEQPAPVEGYPAVVPQGQATEAQTPAEGYPAGPGAVPARENHSRLTAKVLEKAPDANNDAFTRLHVQVATSQAVGDSPDMTARFINQAVDLYAETALMPDLQVGDTLEAEVVYTGDENGGRINALQIKKVTQ